MPISNIVPSNIDPTINYFNKVEMGPVSAEVNEAIIGFFQTQTQTKAAAKLLASAVIKASINQGLDPMGIIKQFSELPAGQLNLYLVLFLNLQRPGTSSLGLSNAPPTNKYLTRTILP